MPPEAEKGVEFTQYHKDGSVRARGRMVGDVLTGYWEWVLGELRHKTLLHVQTEVDPKTGALLARNNYNTEFAERIAFIDVTDPARTVTGNRKEFLGRNGSRRGGAYLRTGRRAAARA